MAADVRTARARDSAYDLCCWMVEHRMTTKVLAAELGCHVMALSNWRLGKSKPRRDFAARLERITGIKATSWDDAPSTEASK